MGWLVLATRAWGIAGKLVREEAFRAQYAQLHNYNQRFQLLFVQNQLLEINCCRHISVNLARQAFISFFIV